jgi:hypothetical protein
MNPMNSMTPTRRRVAAPAVLLALLPPLLLALLLTGGGAPVMAAQPSHADRLQARAVESFRAGRFPEAYGRFVELANLGHPPAARYALLMCEHGMPLFGKAWDCSEQEISEWAAAAGVVPFQLAPLVQSRPLPVAGRSRR